MALICEKCELPSLDLIKYVTDDGIVWVCVWCHGK